MQTKDLTVAFVIFAMAASFATASQAEDCETTCGGTTTPTDPGGGDPEPKGNNGWGNGIDGDNPGTDEGPASQVSTKQNDSVWDKFVGKHEGR